ncbi:MAG TPA: ATP-binding protein [Mycobacteriales bacterium]|nr:ATP-binding protein [Mycobacteriales bacterium]
MARSRSRDRVAPLTVVVGLATLAATLCTLAVAAVVLDANGRILVPLWQLLVAGTPMALLLAIAAAAVASRYARLLRLLRADAVHRLHDPSAPVGAGALKVPDWAGSELAELARTLDALHLRVRMSDEVAERHRRSAETASAGMFELLSGLVAAEEGARGQLAAELHDTVAQSLMTARSMLSDVDGNIPQAAELVSEAEDQVRAVMARTRPPALRDGDLARAVESLRDDLANRYGLVVEVGWPEQAYPLPLVTAVTVYRFFQEALLNVVKHADVDDARAALRVDEEWVVATVSDEGPGFDPEDVRSEKGRHVGLGLLRERARLVGGSLEVSSWPAPGTTLTLRLPRGAAGAGGLLPMQRSAQAAQAG